MYGDIRHHMQFLKSVLEHRNQNMTVVHNKFDAFTLRQRKTAGKAKKKAPADKRIVNIKFDTVSKLHLFTRSCITASYKAAGLTCPRVVYSSLPKVISKFSTKRSVVGKVKERINHGS